MVARFCGDARRNVGTAEHWELFCDDPQATHLTKQLRRREDQIDHAAAVMALKRKRPPQVPLNPPIAHHQAC